jgi:hypothetical protein
VSEKGVKGPTNDSPRERGNCLQTHGKGDQNNVVRSPFSTRCLSLEECGSSNEGEGSHSVRDGVLKLLCYQLHAEFSKIGLLTSSHAASQGDDTEDGRQMLDWWH